MALWQACVTPPRFINLRFRAEVIPIAESNRYYAARIEASVSYGGRSHREQRFSWGEPPLVFNHLGMHSCLRRVPYAAHRNVKNSQMERN